MRVLLFTSEFPPGPGGIGSHAFQVARHLTLLGWEVLVLSLQEYSSKEEIENFNLAQSFSMVYLRPEAGGPFKAAYRLNLLRQWVKSWGPDALLASGERMVWLTAFLSRFRPFPWIAVGHGFEFGTPIWWERYITRNAFNQATSIISVSEYTRSRMLEFGVHPQKEKVIPNGADEDLFSPINKERIALFRQQHGLGDHPLLLTVGNVTERKGQDVVIRALPEILQAIPEVHYLIVGLPTLRDRLTDIAQKLGVADRVHFLGRLDSQSLVEAYNACDVYVMTSRHSKSGDFEGYGIAAVEAALCGKPAVVSGDSGLKEAILPDQTGLVVPVDDPEATATAITRLLQDATLRFRFGSKARERALKEQTWTNRVALYDQTLCEIISEPGKHGDACVHGRPTIISL